MPTLETSPEQCLDRILLGTGIGFMMGLLGGFPFHLLKGFCVSPNGARLAGAWQAMGLKAPRVAGKFAAWGALGSAFDFTLGCARQKDDRWNGIASTAAASGLISARRSLGASARFAALGGAIIALINAGEIMLDKADAGPMPNLELVPDNS